LVQEGSTRLHADHGRGESQEFVSLEIKLEVTQSKYFLAAAKRFAKDLVGMKIPSIPLPESWKPAEGSDADRETAKGLPYRELMRCARIPIDLCQAN
jgi:hypothetical protein